ncbi:hypothetical protein [Nocardia canadensis]|uniref:hypothetical protein n=1 Tax=Nocardia canadensis TaxID=3065238 RepID=UPI0037431E65
MSHADPAIEADSDSPAEGLPRRNRSRWSRAVSTSADSEAPGDTDTDPPDRSTDRRAPRRPVPGDEQAAADLVRRKLRGMPTDLDRAKATRRLVDMLARRGYSPAIAYAVVKAELAEADR